MTSTFLVEVEIDSITPDSLQQDADDMMDDLSNAGWDAVSVKPWTAPQQANEPLLPLSQTLG